MSAEPWVNVMDGPFLREWEARQRSPVDAVPTGFPSLDATCGDDGGRRGLALGWDVTLGGNPGAGKSLFGLNLAWAALRSGYSVAFVSLEMSRWALATRLYAIATGTPVRQLERGQDFNPGDLSKRIRQLWTENHCADLHVNREPFHELADVESYIEGALLGGVSVFFLDYLQLVGAGDDDNIYRQTTEVAVALRRIAHTRGALVVGLSQYQRRTSADRTQKPTAQSLHGGMSLEANSDLVLLLDHSRHERDAVHPWIARTWLLVGKNRHGAQAEVPVEWDYRTLRVREAEADEEGRWPGARRKE